ncbi:hypothetical protein C8J56DRAFT_1065436 [Mycena floridula]|nr:hypothetical protein C8J56DRAFT_1065436 [Mycena floridula]
MANQSTSGSPNLVNFNFDIPLPPPASPLLSETLETHPVLRGDHCDSQGNILPPGAPPPPIQNPPAFGDFAPFESHASFELTDLIYHCNKMPAGQIDELCQIWASSLPPDTQPPFANKADLYSTIDNITAGNLPPWESFTLKQNMDNDSGDPAPWKLAKFEVFFHNPLEMMHSQLGNPDFKGEMDFSARWVFDTAGKRRYRDFMSGNWAWRQSDIIAQDETIPNADGAVFCPIILGSNKTTVSVVTGQNDYYPLYMSNGLVHNSVRHAHHNAVSLIAFLAVPKTDRQHSDSADFRTFRRQVFHESLCRILKYFRQGMERPEPPIWYGDGYYHCTIYGISLYIADYPEQVLLACIVQGWCTRCTIQHDDLDGPGDLHDHEHTEALCDVMDSKTLWDDYGVVDGIMPFTHGFPSANIHELLSSDLLHQLIKGKFKDHLVTWVGEYLEIQHGQK